MFSIQSQSILPKAQFRAIILAGYGSDLYPLINNTPTTAASDSQIKPLLPVASKKMIDWVLERLEEAGVDGTSVVHT
jgi:translation initiation factor eIF-2B subunit gamma